jgi:hypothetical protein
VTALDAALEQGRREAEALMVDEVALYRPGPDVFDRENGHTVPGPHLVDFYSGRARVKPDTAVGQEVEAGEQQVVLRGFTVSLPWSTPLPPGGARPAPGDLVDVTASRDARLVGLRLWVTGVEYSSTATAWRIRAEDRS